MSWIPQSIVQRDFTHVLYTDASLEGWGAVFTDISAGGRWSPNEKLVHINILEMKH